ncbi:GNAT family N-acetyltransferase [Reyranella sp. CPCC 100927]|uniref:GNAT family N-acetyltransferase n=1 Tax=Reyranella sp. CPCC 100927 TaxID=2599616 RepID=UPI0011B6573A|nr:GNAT family N-acetyltransferase [Reyranella sp. CPCC 100927]TWS97891.1 GNAT family N-acetyltransferase [Reyranella sp. CPCC 100927]
MITIRTASYQDVANLPAIEKSSGSIFEQWRGLEWIANDDVQSEDEHRFVIANGVALVAEHNEQGLVAFLNGEFMSNELHIWQIAVHRDHQGQGIGRKLIEAVRRIAIAKGGRALTLTTFRDVPWNEPYYRRLGFDTLDVNDVPPRLADILNKEAHAGLPPEQRCAMVMAL